MLSKCAGPLMKFALPLAKNVVSLGTIASASSIGYRGRGVVSTVKGIILVISNKEMNDIIRTIKLLGYSGALIDGVSEAVKHEEKNK